MTTKSAQIETTFEFPEDEPVVLISRTFEAPQKLVWEVLSNPAHVPLWYGPRGSSTRVVEMEFRVGGKWRYAVSEPDGQAYEFFGEYLEITPTNHIRQTFGFMDYPPAIETMTLTDLGLKTRMVVRAVYTSMEGRDGMVQAGMEAGARDTYERMDEVLAGLAAKG